MSANAARTLHIEEHHAPRRTGLLLGATGRNGEREFIFACGCIIREHVGMREAEVCPEHADWKIEAHLIRYLPTAKEGTR